MRDFLWGKTIQSDVQQSRLSVEKQIFSIRTPKRRSGYQLQDTDVEIKPNDSTTLTFYGPDPLQEDPGTDISTSLSFGIIAKTDPQSEFIAPHCAVEESKRCSFPPFIDTHKDLLVEFGGEVNF